jgi:hypothetical protein
MGAYQKMDLRSQQILIPLALVGVTAFFLGVYGFGKETTLNPFKEKNLLLKGLDAPTIWLYYDSSDVNARWWADFGARSTRVLNLPFLNLCYERICKFNSDKYKIEVISGLTDLAGRLGGWQELPVGLQNPLANVGDAELNWIRAEVLCRFGGLWVHPAAVCLRPFPEIPQDKVLFLGTDADASYAGPGGSALPSFYVIGAGRKNHPVFEQWAQAAFERLDKRGGGQQFRGDAKWDYSAFAAKNADTIVYPNLELSRRPDGKRIQLEDLLAAGQQGDLRFKVSEETVYCPIPWPELRERRMFGWFLRMNEEQILSSDLAISDLFRAL